MTLKDRILDEIHNEGPLTVARFIEHALYDDEDGYYAAGTERAGTEWFTAPTLHPIYGWTLARGLAPFLEACNDPMLVEAGTGSGELTRDLCYGLNDADPDTFEHLNLHLVDASRTVLDRARETLKQAGIGLEAATFSTELPETIHGVLVTNELLDALPVHLCRSTNDGVEEIHVTTGDPTLTLTAAEPSNDRVRTIAQRIASQHPPGRIFEVPLAAYDWYADAAARLERGALVTIDYGDTRANLLDAYPKGTIHAYRQGRQVDEFYYDPGQMDITYRVPFDEIQTTGEDAGLDTHTYATQGCLLDALGIRDLADDARDRLAAKKLIDPNGAGSTFRILVQTHNLASADPWLEQA